MELIVTHRQRLIRKYNESVWSNIEFVLDKYLDALGSIGIDARLFLLDDVLPDMKPHQDSVKAALQALHLKYSPKYLVFLGGDDIVPFYRLPDQTPDHFLDKNILSDTYYVDFNENEHIHWPEIAVGRLPDGGVDCKLLIDQLQRATESHRSGGLPLSKTHAGFSTQTWSSASKLTYFRLDDSGKTLRISPPVGMKQDIFTGVNAPISIADFPQGGIIFFNVHGHREKPCWWGEEKLLGFPVRTPELMNYELLHQIDLNNSVILCQACHSTAISNGRTSENSLALCAIMQGTQAFFGCTVKSYAFTLPEGKPSGASGIDALFQTMIYHLIVKQVRFGDALREAKQFHVYNNAFDEKNILGLVLLGDPMLCFRREKRDGNS